MWRSKLEPKGASVALPVGGAIQAVDLTTGVQNRRLIVEVTGEITQAANAGNVAVNRGSILAALRFFLSEGGADVWKQVDPRIARWLTGVLGGASLPATRITTAQAVAGVAGMVLREQFVLNFGNPRGVSERESFYLEANSAQRFQLRGQLLGGSAAGAAARIVQGPGAASLANVTFNVIQDYALNEPGLPLFKPQWTVQSVPVVGASANLRELILTAERLRGIVIQQDTDQGEQSDIINAFALRGDNGDIIGPDFVNFQDLRDTLAAYYGGIEAATQGYYFIDFMPDGRLSSLAFPNAQFTNLRFQFDCLPSVGRTGSAINIVLLEYARPTPTAGKAMVEPVLPAFAEVG